MIPTPAEFLADMANWQALAPVDPEADARAWSQTCIPVCRFDGRKWAGKKLADLIVSCSGPASFWEEDRRLGAYGYCAYHWSLHVHKQLLAGNVIANPKYTAADRARDQGIAEAYAEQRLMQGLPTYL